jgi:hypothetical protein
MAWIITETAAGDQRGRRLTKGVSDWRPVKAGIPVFSWRFKSFAGNLPESRKFSAVTGSFRSSVEHFEFSVEEPRNPMEFGLSARRVCFPRAI